MDLSTARLTLVSGDDQKGIVGETAPNALSVQVVDAAGAAIGGATVDWIFAQGKGRGSAISPNAERVSTTTDQQGNSSVQWTFGPTAGTQQALAELSTNLPMTVGASTAPPQHNGRRVGFTSQVRASHPASVTVEPSSVRIESGDQITLKATVTDKFGNILENVSVDWSSAAPGVAAVEDTNGVLEGVSEGSTSVIAMAGSATGETSVEVIAALPAENPDSTDTQDPGPQSISNLIVAGVTDSTVTLRWTQVEDGYGEPANYVLRAATPEIAWAEAGDMQTTFLGTEIGATAEYTWTDLTAGIQYEFQLVPHSGEFGAAPVFGPLSNIARGVTSTTSEPAEPSLTALEIRRVGSSLATSSISLTVGETTHLEAIGLDQNGGSMGIVDASWATSDNISTLVSTTGVVSAVATGAARIAARFSGSSAVLDVFVRDTTSVPASSTYDSEPQNFVAADDGSFDWDRIPGQYDHWGWWQRAGSLNIVTDPTAPLGDDQVGQFFYPAGMTSGHEPGVGGYDFRGQEPVREFFAGWWGKLDADWIPHPFQLKWTIMSTNSGSNAWFWTDISGEGETPNLRLRFQGNEWGMEQLQPQNVQADLVPFVYGEWTKIEVHARYGDPGQSNGEFRLWQNGTLIVHVSGVEVPGTGFTSIHHTGTYGGCCHDIPQDQSWYIAHTYVSVPGA